MATAMSYVLLVFGVALLPAVNGQCINVTLPEHPQFGRVPRNYAESLSRTRRMASYQTSLVFLGLTLLGSFHAWSSCEATELAISVALPTSSVVPLEFPLFNCGTFSPGNIVCQEPLQISLPSVFNVGADSILRELLQAVGVTHKLRGPTGPYFSAPTEERSKMEANMGRRFKVQSGAAAMVQVI
ncbi:hypothetical protein MTO96_017535 [Rhipicephalus appendiculatus]